MSDSDRQPSLAAWRAPDDELRALALKNRERLALRMTPEQLVEAETLARTWEPKGEMLADERSVATQAR